MSITKLRWIPGVPTSWDIMDVERKINILQNVAMLFVILYSNVYIYKIPLQMIWTSAI